MRTFACSQVVPGCEGTVTGADDNEVLAKAAEHARTAHGMDRVPDDVVAAIRAGITDV